MRATKNPRRSDAVRNDERIYEGALAELGRDPSADMEAIAAACGVSRATLFRRYPSRDALLVAVRERAHSHLAERVASADLKSGSAGEALGRLIEALVDASIPYSFLLRNPGGDDHRPGHFVAGPIEALIRRGQRGGEFRDDASPRWWADAIIALLQVVNRDAAYSADAARLMRATLADGLRAA